MELYDELEGLYKNGTSIEKIYEFLIGCVEAQLKFRSSGVVEKASNVMKLYLEGVIERSEVARINWHLEAESLRSRQTVNLFACMMNWIQKWMLCGLKVSLMPL